MAVITTLFYIFLPTIFEDMLHHIQTKQGLAFGAALIAIIILCFYKRILDHTLSQTKSAYTRYVKSYIYTKNFLWFITLRAIMILCMTQAIWFLCDHFHINILNRWFDGFLSPEHWVLSFALAAITFQALHQKALQKSKDNIYKYYQTRGRYISKDTKAYVRKRDKGRCRKCRSRKKLEYDHIIPYSKGGKNTPNNIQLLCRKCNRSKGARIR